MQHRASLHLRHQRRFLIVTTKKNRSPVIVAFSVGAEVPSSSGLV
jgi:hypothetical protein